MPRPALGAGLCFSGEIMRQFRIARNSALSVLVPIAVGTAVFVYVATPFAYVLGLFLLS